ncbi:MULTISPECIES: (Fe-S)-binding protein [Sphingobacterium]|uniref:Heterodisulfide reductase-related iron-sulfur binding cluster n=1 Tax=Sphingobacterium populi TaxID=1812824 RepID=A0ABW5UIH9_9SPHI|nr:(Fe-S)-binding protein [Sphingobacterium sp. CFCC 11742]
MHKVELSIPGVIDQLYPQTAFHLLRLLERAGCEVSYNPLQTTCGIDLYEAGYWEEAKEIGAKYLNDFEGIDYIVSPSFTEVGMIRDGFNDLFTNSTDHNKCRQMQRNIFEISDFLVNVVRKEYFGAEFVSTAIFHPSCAQWNGYQLHDEALRLLKQVGGLELITDKQPSKSCKIGRATKADYVPLSVAWGTEVIEYGMANKADYIICQDHTCLLHLQGIIEKKEFPIQTIHLVDVLTAGWPNI